MATLSQLLNFTRAQIRKIYLQVVRFNSKSAKGTLPVAALAFVLGLLVGPLFQRYIKEWASRYGLSAEQAQEKIAQRVAEKRQHLLEQRRQQIQLELQLLQAERRGGFPFQQQQQQQQEEEEQQLPTFFPPKATATVEIPLKSPSEEVTLAELSYRISIAMSDAGYEERTYFWLEKAYGPGFAIVTHIEQIHADGTPVARRRWSFDLPRYENFSIASFLKALIKADPGNYRMIALVVSKQPLVEKPEPITAEQVGKLSAGPKFLAEKAESELAVTEAYHCMAYIYEFERKTRNDDPTFKDSSDISASNHLASTPLWGALTQLR